MINVRFYVANNGFDLTFAHRTLVTGLLEAGPDFLAIERDPRAVFLDDFQGRFFDFLVSRKSPLANQAFAAPPDHKVLAGPGIDALRLPVPTEWAHHVAITVFETGSANRRRLFHSANPRNSPVFHDY